MFTVKEINRLKILQDAIDRNLHPDRTAGMVGFGLKQYRQTHR